MRRDGSTDTPPAALDGYDCPVQTLRMPGMMCGRHLAKSSWYSARDFGSSAFIFAGEMKFSLQTDLARHDLVEVGRSGRRPG